MAFILDSHFYLILINIRLLFFTSYGRIGCIFHVLWLFFRYLRLYSYFHPVPSSSADTIFILVTSVAHIFNIIFNLLDLWLNLLMYSASLVKCWFMFCIILFILSSFINVFWKLSCHCVYCFLYLFNYIFCDHNEHSFVLFNFLCYLLNVCCFNYFCPKWSPDLLWNSSEFWEAFMLSFHLILLLFICPHLICDEICRCL